MPKTFIALIAGFFAVFTGIAAPAVAEDAAAWKADPAKSKLTFTGRQMRVPSTGEFRKFTPVIRFDPKNLAGSKVAVVIDTASASAGNKDIEKELKKPKWFHVEKFPRASFVTTKIVAKGGDKYEATAELTIRDKKRVVTMPFTVKIDGTNARAAGELSIKRLDYDIGIDEWKDTNIVADEVVIRFDLAATRQ